MKILYFDCQMGAAGDMLTAALLELLPDPDGFIDELNALGIPGVRFTRERSVKCGITGTHLSVTVNGEEEHSHDHDHAHEHIHSHEHEHIHEHEHHDDHEHHDHEHSHTHEHEHTHSHSSLHDIEHIVRGHLSLPERVADNVMAVYERIAEAESHAHGVPVTEIHFHEVGTMDAVADITAFCLLIDRLSPDKIVSSPICVGSGQVHCAHGILPVPAPATAYILRDVPSYGSTIRGELCTPTGAALLRQFADEFGSMPLMKVEQLGYGMGKKDFEAANCVRAMLGWIDTASDEVCELSCNLDDMTGEEIGSATERLFSVGALDVYTIPIGMKKNRPGVLLRVLCRENDREAVVRAIFKYTTTLGIRENKLRRYVLDRHVEEVDTQYGRVRCKVSSGYGVERRKLEYDDIARIADENGMSLRDLSSLIER